MRLSIVIPSYQSAKTIEACLASLVPQCGASSEIVVVDSGTDGAAERVAERFPEVRLIRSAQRLHPGAARNRGLRAARGSIIGFVDADCVASSDWVARVLASHRKASGAVGGVIANASPRRLLDWAAYFCSFHLWIPGTPAGDMRDIPTCCLSFERSVLDRQAPFREEGFSSDTELNWRMADAGTLLRFDPEIRVAHFHQPTWGSFASRQWSRGRAFARMRVRAERFGLGRRALHAAAVPALPFVLLARLARRVLVQQTPPEYRDAFVASAPLVFLGFVLWSLGEASGYASTAS